MSNARTAVTPHFDASQLRWGRIVTSLIFFILGASIATWLGRIADIQKQLRLDPGVLGLILLAGAVSGLAAMQMVPWLLRRFGHRAVLALMAPVYPLTVLGIPFAGNAWTLVVGLVLFNATGSVMGVIVNTHAVDVEEAYERAIMSSFHAMFSIGGLVGASVAAIVTAARVSVPVHMLAVAIILSAVTAALIARLLPEANADPNVVAGSLDHHADHHHRRAWWRGVILLGALCFTAYMAEGAVADWSAIFMREVRHAPAGVAVIAYVAFSACMAAGRLLGDRLSMRFGRVQVVRAGALLACCGLIIGLFIPTVPTSIIGFGIVGCGLAVLVPVLFSIAGNLGGGETHAAIARVSTIAYFGLLVGPAFIGLIAHTFGLHYALLVPATLLLASALSAPLIYRVTRASARL